MNNIRVEYVMNRKDHLIEIVVRGGQGTGCRMSAEKTVRAAKKSLIGIRTVYERL